MDEAELEDKFSRQREELEEKLVKDLATKGVDPDKALANFDAKYRQLIAKYQQTAKYMIEKTQRDERIQRPWRQLNTAADELTLNVKVWFSKHKFSVRKWLFERKIKRMLRHQGPY